MCELGVEFWKPNLENCVASLMGASSLTFYIYKLSNSGKKIVVRQHFCNTGETEIPDE